MIKAYAKSDIGKVREINQDSYYISDSLDEVQLYMLADGMGGCQGGEIASKLAIQSAKNYIENNFKEIEKDIRELAKSLDLYDVVIIPVSATEGDNVTKRSENMPWYTGPVLLSHLENVDVSETEEDSVFYMPVQRVCRPNHEFRSW